MKRIIIFCLMMFATNIIYGAGALPTYEECFNGSGVVCTDEQLLKGCFNLTSTDKFCTPCSLENIVGIGIDTNNIQTNNLNMPSGCIIGVGKTFSDSYCTLAPTQGNLPALEAHEDCYFADKTGIFRLGEDAPWATGADGWEDWDVDNWDKFLKRDICGKVGQ